jgi:hypothetical protein
MLESYPILNCDKGAKEALLIMSSDWNEEMHRELMKPKNS